MNKLSCINIDISLCFFSPINDSSTVRKHKNQERVKKQLSPSPAPEVKKNCNRVVILNLEHVQFWLFLAAFGTPLTRSLPI